jgi:hypothetical protein
MNFVLWTRVFPGYVSILKALRARQQDARRPDRSFAEVALANPTMQAVQMSRTEEAAAESKSNATL